MKNEYGKVYRGENIYKRREWIYGNIFPLKELAAKISGRYRFICDEMKRQRKVSSGAGVGNNGDVCARDVEEARQQKMKNKYNAL